MPAPDTLFLLDPLGITVASCIAFFGALTLVYSIEYTLKRDKLSYYITVLLTLASALAAVLTSNLVLFLVCWGLSGVLLYLLIGYGTAQRTPATARKALVIIGGTDAFMMLGLALVYRLGGSLDIHEIRIGLDQPHALVAYLCLLVGVLAKAGAVPLHTWLPDTAEDAPAPVTAFLPASVDKLLGIYLLARMSLDIFVMTPAMNTLLLVIGALTIISAGLLMLVQRDFRRTLGYCAVSQVGYILLGIGSANPIGIAGGLFHMVNHAIYKSCLFFCSGAVEQRTGTGDIERLGGLAGKMPVVAASFTIAALAVSGVPPLNGFASKWMVYQGIIESGRSGGAAWILWLLVAMFGSALTLAGMMKLVHALFLGQPASGRADPAAGGAPTPALMLIPPLVLALLCVVFGIWAYDLPLQYLILPILEQELAFRGIWQPTLATLMILVGLGLGLSLYLLGRVSRGMRESEVFIGGERLDAVPGMRVSGGAFYNTVRDLPGLKRWYVLAEKGTLDPCVFAARFTDGAYRVLGALHSGVLSTYLAWCLLGMGILFYMLLLR